MTDRDDATRADTAADSDGERSPDARAADHAGIDRLTTEVLPALVARLAATGLAELEVREDDWRLRVRRPATGTNHGRRATDRPGRSQPGHAAHGHAPSALEGHRVARSGSASSNGANPGPGSTPSSGGDAGLPGGTIATSPAVGIFQPRPDLRPGTAVKAGDRLGIVDVLGIPQEIVAPADGIVGTSLAEAGNAVEYGQDLIRIELTAAGGSGPAAATGGDPGGDA